MATRVRSIFLVEVCWLPILMVLASYGFGNSKGAQVRYASSLSWQIKSYAQNLNYVFKGGQPHKVKHLGEDFIYVNIKPENADHIVRIDRTSLDLRKYSLSDANRYIRFHSDYEFATLKAYLLFDPEEPHLILDYPVSRLKIKYRNEGTALSMTVDASEFRVMDGRLPEFALKPLDELNRHSEMLCFLVFRNQVEPEVGFLLYIEGQLYCLSSQRIFQQQALEKITLLDGKALLFETIDFSDRGDVARIRLLEDRYAFNLFKDPEPQETALCFRFPDDRSSFQLQNGEISHIGDGRFRIDDHWDVTPGSPVFNRKNVVIGVASTTRPLTPTELATNKRWGAKSKKINFGSAISSDAHWHRLDTEKFASQNYRLFEAEQLIAEFTEIYQELNRNKTAKLEESDYRSPTMRKWLRYRSGHWEKKIEGAKWLRVSDSNRIWFEENEKLWLYLGNLLKARQVQLQQFTPYPDNQSMGHRIADLRAILQHAEELCAQVSRGKFSNNSVFSQ